MRKTLYTIDLVDTLTDATKKGLGIAPATTEEIYNSHPRCGSCRYFKEETVERSYGEGFDTKSVILYSCINMNFEGHKVGEEFYCADWMPQVNADLAKAFNLPSFPDLIKRGQS